MKAVRNYLLVFVGLIAGYLLFALGTSLLPNAPIERHVCQTLEKDDLKADFWFAFVYKPNYYMDNFTDALVVNQASQITPAGCQPCSLWQRVMLNPRWLGEGEECASLKSLTEGDGTMTLLFYPRYWHGSTFLMRLLLMFGDYTVLRTLFYIISSLLLLWVLLALGSRVGAWAAILYGMSLLLVDVFMMQFSIQFLPVLLLAMVGSLWVLYRVKNGRQLCMLLFVLGSLTAFFDLLTCPLLTWGVPLLVWLLMASRQDKIEVSLTAIAAVLWGVGYAATWATKWLLAALTTTFNVLSDASSQAAVRSSAGDHTRWTAVMHNVDMVPWDYFWVIVIPLVVLAVFYFRPRGWKAAVLCLVVALVPVVWYMVVAEHSYLHSWFTYRILSVMIMGLLFAVACMVDWQRISLFNPKGQK